MLRGPKATRKRNIEKKNGSVGLERGKTSNLEAYIPVSFWVDVCLNTLQAPLHVMLKNGEFVVGKLEKVHPMKISSFPHVQPKEASEAFVGSLFTCFGRQIVRCFDAPMCRIRPDLLSTKVWGFHGWGRHQKAIKFCHLLQLTRGILEEKGGMNFSKNTPSTFSSVFQPSKISKDHFPTDWAHFPCCFGEKSLVQGLHRRDQSSATWRKQKRKDEKVSQKKTNRWKIFPFSVADGFVWKSWKTWKERTTLAM